MADMMSSPVKVNKNAVLGALAVGGLLLYIVYTTVFSGYSSSSHSSSSGTFLVSGWKTKDFAQIPDELKEKQSTIHIDEHHVTFDVDGEVSATD